MNCETPLTNTPNGQNCCLPFGFTTKPNASCCPGLSICKNDSRQTCCSLDDKRIECNEKKGECCTNKGPALVGYSCCQGLKYQNEMCVPMNQTVPPQPSNSLLPMSAFPLYHSISPSLPPPSKSSKLSTGTIIGIIIGSLFGIILLIIGLLTTPAIKKNKNFWNLNILKKNVSKKNVSKKNVSKKNVSKNFWNSQILFKSSTACALNKSSTACALNKSSTACTLNKSSTACTLNKSSTACALNKKCKMSGSILTKWIALSVTVLCISIALTVHFSTKSNRDSR